MAKAKYQNLRILRILNDDTQIDVAEAIGMNPKTYHLKETGHSDFTIEEAKKILEKYGKKFEEVFN
jgi:DNA-binding XRE family transcriptional regulator